MATTALAFLAGILSTLSPCVLPLLPIVLGTALSEHRAGPARAGGGARAVVRRGRACSSRPSALRSGSTPACSAWSRAILLIAVGARAAGATVPGAVRARRRPGRQLDRAALRRLLDRGLGGQFAVGLLLGAVWSPCVGPTLGAASVLASQGNDLGAVAVTMLAFGLGAALPLVLLGLVSREAMMRWRERLLAAGQRGKLVMGVVLVATGLLIVTGARQGDRNRPRRSVAGVVE